MKYPVFFQKGFLESVGLLLQRNDELRLTAVVFFDKLRSSSSDISIPSSYFYVDLHPI
ncbi:hypothetical protein RDI58_022138 [Solanum bulbocastanum]|uniref:Uncharacterized protein n=1 Tax=Solanum bulbocastanum TaxID=147425 RepID=A0AAN8T244_SOLBU